MSITGIVVVVDKPVGTGVGAVGNNVGCAVGVVGAIVGRALGDGVGTGEGTAEGTGDGSGVGSAVGSAWINCTYSWAANTITPKKDEKRVIFHNTNVVLLNFVRKKTPEYL